MVVGDKVSSPLADVSPLHAPLFVHVVVIPPVLFQVSVELFPSAIVVESALRVTSGGDTISTVTDFVSVPAIFVHVIVYVWVAVGVTLSLPLDAIFPLQPSDLEQDGSVPIDDHVRFELCPRIIDPGSAENVISGGVTTVTITVVLLLPAEFSQVSVYDNVEVGVIVCDPLVVEYPSHPLLREHIGLVPVTSHDNIELSPGSIFPGLAVKVT